MLIDDQIRPGQARELFQVCNDRSAQSRPASVQAARTGGRAIPSWEDLQDLVVQYKRTLEVAEVRRGSAGSDSLPAVPVFTARRGVQLPSTAAGPAASSAVSSANAASTPRGRSTGGLLSPDEKKQGRSRGGGGGRGGGAGRRAAAVAPGCGSSVRSRASNGSLVSGGGGGGSISVRFSANASVKQELIVEDGSGEEEEENLGPPAEVEEVYPSIRIQRILNGAAMGRSLTGAIPVTLR